MPPAQKKSRNTKQLEIIWGAIKDDNSHPTADQVYQRVRKKLPKISLGTVYRNLQKLVVDERLQVLTQGRLQRFDPLTDRHQHFICERCNRVYDVLVEQQNEIKPVKLPHAGFKVISHQLTFYGICKHCSV